MKARVAVYGTLREGEHNHRLLEKGGAELLGTSFIPGYIMVNLGNFPGIVPVRNPEWEILAEVYEVDQETLAALDRLEGVGNDFYDRENVDLPLFGKTYIYVTSPKYFGMLYASRRWIGMFMGGDWMEEDTYDMEDEDIQSYVVESYLRKAGIPVIVDTSPPKPKSNVIPLPSPQPKPKVLPPPNWDAVFGGAVVEAKEQANA